MGKSYDLPLHRKVNALVMLGVAVGLGLGVGLERYIDHLWLIFAVGLAVMGVLVWMVYKQVVEPVDRFVHQVELLARTCRPELLRKLPDQRHDEIGKLACAIKSLASESIQNHHEAGRLKRNLDDRVARATRRATHQLQQQVFQDPLTGLGNRRFMEEQVQLLYEQTVEAGQAMTCMMIDIDNFKQINDQFGHPVGDQILRLLAKLLRGSVRVGDQVVRLGGDEFGVWMPDITMSRAQQLGETLCGFFTQQVSALHLGELKMGLSIGLATSQHDLTATTEALLVIADKRLCDAKRRGKGMTVGFSAA